MICSLCNMEAIVNQAEGKEFFYCRTCKIEPTEKRDINYPILPPGSIHYNANTFPGSVNPSFGPLIPASRAFFDNVSKIQSSPHQLGSALRIPFTITTQTGLLPSSPHHLLSLSTPIVLWWLIPADLNPFSVYLNKWLPGSLQLSTLPDIFYGIDRNLDRIQLAGNWYDGTGKTIEEGIINLSYDIMQRGGNVDTVFMHLTDFTNLCKHLGNFSPISYHTIIYSHSKINVYPDSDCPKGFVYLVQMNTWEYSLNFNALYCTNLAFNGVLKL